MIRQYKEICKTYRCRAKVFTQMKDGLKGKIGSPDLLVLFTGTASHKMIKLALNSANQKTVIVRSHTSSASALKNILHQQTGI